MRFSLCSSVGVGVHLLELVLEASGDNTIRGHLCNNSQLAGCGTFFVHSLAHSAWPSRKVEVSGVEPGRAYVC